MYGRALMLGAVALVAVPAAAAPEDGPPIAVQTPLAERVAWPVHRAVIAFGHPYCGRAVVVLADFVDPLTAAGADPTTCRIFFNRRLYPRMPGPMVCTLVLHEYGHLAGRRDSDDPRTVMYRYYRRPDRRCVSR